MTRTNVLPVLLTTIALIAVGAILTRADVPEGSAGRLLSNIPPTPAPFAQRVAGTYLDEGEIGGGPFTGLQTLHADGTHLSQNTNCCGHGDPEANGPQGNGQGVWERTGDKQVTITAIIFVYDLLGNLAVIAKPTVVMDFDEALEEAEGTITTRIYLPTQDLLDPDEEPLVTVEGTDSWRRLHLHTN